MVTGGRGFGVANKLEGHAGHERMVRIKRYFGSDDPHPPAKVKYDNQYTFDKVTNVYNGGVLHEENQPAHLLISDTEVCITRCTEEYGNPCFHFCPAQVYEPQETADGRGRVPFLNFTNCFHCKTCDIMDPYQVITWVPAGGRGGAELQEVVACYRDGMKVRPILRPITEGTHVTLAEARAVFRELKREQDALVKKKAQTRRKSAGKVR